MGTFGNSDLSCGNDQKLSMGELLCIFLKHRPETLDLHGERRTRKPEKEDP